MMRWMVPLVLIPLAGCAELGAALDPAPPVAPVGAAAAPVLLPPPPPPPSDARTAEEFDTTTEAERVAATAPVPVAEERLGTTIGSLGSPTVPGIWMLTGLVTEPVMGRVEVAATGKSVTLELRPSGGAASAGSQVSLAALRLLEVPLTDLPELIVYRLPG